MTTNAIDESYRLGAFRDNLGSLNRLKKQASIALDQEFQHLVAAGLSPGERVLDVGCGPGIVASELAARMQPRRLVAADCNDQCLKECRDTFQQRGLVDAEVRNANVYDDGFMSGETFDFAYSRFLFQHLSSPLSAIRNIAACLASRGRLCICDVDDAWLAVNPRPPEVDSFLNRVGAAQKSRGGDRNVGTKLSHYLRQAGFRDIRSSVLLASTDQIDKTSFCDLVFGYKLEVVPDGELELARREVAQIRESLDAPTGWAGVAAFFVSGTGPERE